MACEKMLHEVPAMDFDARVKVGLEMIVEDIRGLNLKLAELEKTTAEEGSKLNGQKILTASRTSIQ